MKLLIGTHYFESHGGGIEIVAAQLARAIGSDPEIEVSWMASDASPAPAGFPGETISLPCWNITERLLGFPLPVPLPQAIGRIREAIHSCDAVMLHDALYPTNVVAALLARRRSIPLMIVQHVGLVPYRNPALRLAMSLGNHVVAAPVLRAANQAVFISGLTRAYFESFVTFRRPPETVFNGIRAEILAAGATLDRTTARQILKIPGETFVALFVGRFVNKKGLHVLRRLVHDLTGVHWIMCGWGPEDPGQWGADNVQVIYRANAHQLATAYRAADVLVLPSVGEGLPLVVQEALSLGTGVIASTDLLHADPWLEGRIVATDIDHGDVPGTAARIAEAIDRFRKTTSGAADLPGQALERYEWSVAAARYRAILAGFVGQG